MGELLVQKRKLAKSGGFLGIGDVFGWFTGSVVPTREGVDCVLYPASISEATMHPQSEDLRGFEFKGMN